MVLSAIIVPRHAEQRLSKSFGELGSLRSSYLMRRAPTSLDRVIGFPGFVETVVLSGDDLRINSQLRLLTGFRRLDALQASSVSVDSDFKMRGRLSSLHSAEFSYCSGSLIEAVVRASPELERLVVWECMDLLDEHLAVIENCTNLREIRIDGASVTGTFASSRSANNSIVELTLLHTALSKEGVIAISSMTSLKRLTLHSDTCDLPLRRLAALKRLEVLDLVGFEKNASDIDFLRSRLTSTRGLWR